MIQIVVFALFFGWHGEKQPKFVIRGKFPVHETKRSAIQIRIKGHDQVRSEILGRGRSDFGFRREMVGGGVESILIM